MTATAPAYSNTPMRCIRLAMLDAGLLEQGDDPTGEDFAEYAARLIDMINMWQTQGLKLWLQHEQTFSLVEGQNSYTFTPGGNIDITKPLRGLQAYYTDTSNVRRPLLVLSREEWMRLSQIVGNNGATNSYFVDKQATQLVVYLWLTPDAEAATGTVTVLLQLQVTNFTSLTESLNFPIEWFMALRWGLADEIATGQPKDVQDRCTAKATLYRQKLEDWDVEDAPTMFTPDQRSAYATGDFR